MIYRKINYVNIFQKILKHLHTKEKFRKNLDSSSFNKYMLNIKNINTMIREALKKINTNSPNKINHILRLIHA